MIDFPTALGRLLRDGSLRDAFAADAGGVVDAMDACAGDKASLRALSPGELEVQADILLRKRFDLVRPLLPRTVVSLGDGAWRAYREYARCCWPDGPWRDADGFCRHLVSRGAIPRNAREVCRARFVAGTGGFRICWARDVSDVGRNRRAVLIYLRGRKGAWREFAAYAGL